MHYFNCINRKEFKGLSENQQKELLVKKKLFQFYYQVPLQLDLKKGKQRLQKKLSETEKHLKPTSKLRQEFYDFILLHYQHNIKTPFYLFFADFNEEIYGLSRKKQKNKALGYFNSYYQKIKNDSLTSHIRLLSPTGIEHIKNESRFKTLFHQREAAKENLADRELIMEFLFGNSGFFTAELIKENKVLQKSIEFEAVLKILISLNDRYHFEPDFYFSEAGVLREKYQNSYNKLFVSFDAFLFTQEKIHTFEAHKQAHIESLYVALKELELVRGKDTAFISYVNSEHEMKMTKIRKYEAHQNRIHEDRVRIFKEDWHQFSAKK